MRIALIGEGTYPIVRGGVSTWCHQLINGLPEHQFSVVTLTGSERHVVWPVPGNVTGVHLVPMWDPAPPVRWQHLRGQRAGIEAAVLDLWEASLPVDPHTDLDLQRAETGLRGLARACSGGSLAGLLPRCNMTEIVLSVWGAHRRNRPHLPALTLSQAAEVSRHAERMLAVMDVDITDVDLIHLSSNGPCGLGALRRHWDDGTPILLTEHGIYLRERYLALSAGGVDWAVRYAVMSLLRVISRIIYLHCSWLAPVSDFNARWECRLGADDSRIVTIPNGVDPTQFEPIESEPSTPTISFVGRVDPLKDLHTLIEAFARVVKRLPDARLRMFGPTPDGNRAYRGSIENLILEHRLQDAAVFEGPIASARPGFEAGHVVALSSISEGLPFTVMEAMMSARATVSTDVGGVSECTGTDGSAGLIVPPRHPEAMAEALVELLADPARRRAMGRAARDRAYHLFRLERFQNSYRQLYDTCVHPTVVPHCLPAVGGRKVPHLEPHGP